MFSSYYIFGFWIRFFVWICFQRVETATYPLRTNKVKVKIHRNPPVVTRPSKLTVNPSSPRPTPTTLPRKTPLTVILKDVMAPAECYVSRSLWGSRQLAITLLLGMFWVLSGVAVGWVAFVHIVSTVCILWRVVTCCWDWSLFMKTVAWCYGSVLGMLMSLVPSFSIFWVPLFVYNVFSSGALAGCPMIISWLDDFPEFRTFYLVGNSKQITWGRLKPNRRKQPAWYLASLAWKVLFKMFTLLPFWGKE